MPAEFGGYRNREHSHGGPWRLGSIRFILLFPGKAEVFADELPDCHFYGGGL